MSSSSVSIESDIVWGLIFFSTLDRWKRRMVEVVIRAAKMKLSAISATKAMHMSVRGQCESTNESGWVGDGGGESVG